VQLRSICVIQESMAISTLGRRISGACCMNSHFIAFIGMPGAAQGEQ
jgi:hypothetical protein